MALLPQSPNPLSAGPPLVNPFEGFDPVKQYFGGAEERRKYDLARTFKDGLPRKPDGQVDFDAAVEQLAKSGDISHLGPLSTLGLQRDYLNAANKLDSEFGSQSPPQSTPSGAQPPRQASAPTSQGSIPQPEQGESIRTLATGLSGGKDVTPAISQFVRENRIHPDAPLTPEQEAAFKPKLAQLISPAPQQQVGAQQQTGIQTAAPQVTAVIDPALGGLVPKAFVGRFGQEAAGKYIDYASKRAELLAGAGQKGGSEVWQKRAQDVAVALQKASEPTPDLKNAVASGMRSPLDYENSKVQGRVAAENQAFTPEVKQYQLYRQQGGTGSFQQWLSATAGEKKLAEVGAENTALTPDQKNALASGNLTPLQLKNLESQGRVSAENQALTNEQKLARGGDMSTLDYARSQEQQKDDVTRYGKQIQAIQGSAQAANRQLQHVQLAEGLYNDPNLWTGSFEGVNLAYKKLMNVIDPNNKEALPQEAFRKTMAASVLNQVEQLKDDTAAVGGGGRLFQAQIELMERAANNPDNTVPANRLLTEIAKRSALEAKKIASMANKYKGGHLDADFAQLVDDHYTKNPMFTPAEMADVRLIAPPSFQTGQQAMGAKLPSGTPVKVKGEWFKIP